MPEYRLKLVKQRARDGNMSVTPNAINRAWNEFGWDVSDIATVIMRLNHNRHFYKTEPFRMEPHILLDYYKAREIKDGEDVYIHLYIREEDGMLIVNSFHMLD